MAKQLNLNLNIAANTTNAKSSIQELQTLLHSISVGSSINVDVASMKQASQAAQELSIHLNNAYNATTGNFDLSKLDKSLKTSGQNLQALSTKLLQAGSMGEQAFTKLARSIAVADRPLIAMNAKLKEFSTTLMNTARWQLSSSMLHGFIRAISSAYGYAKDLNESLNNIQIVTGRTTEQMAEFAIEANKAAKALSTTTTAYTDAALIYYQQGDSTAEVIEKANITVKMANVVGQSAEVVSDQLTAIWNNFDDGTKSLEYYVDVVTALGAATASSTDEIAQGLEKFAAVADTVGLSYEYATAALATVTATTRQSADVVGTAFKTLFARLNDLKLGETLDDGTTLGTYTENLAKIGVNIKTASGGLKSMDQILDETAEKWKTLDKDQQVALAKGVAGIRQYSQFIALMDNWDFMEENLNTIEMSGGTLEKQADIYAQSWEAASNRVKASAEAIYDALLDDQFFISVSNGFSGLLDSINAFIDSIGGVGGVITMISSLLMSHFAGKIGPALSNVAHSFAIMFQSAQKQASGLANQMNQVVQETLEWDAARKQSGQGGFSDFTVVSLQGSMAINKAKSQLTVIEKELNSIEKQRYETQLNMIQAQQDEAEAAARVVEEIKKKIEAAQSEWNPEATQQVAGKNRDEEEKTLMRNVSDTKSAYLANSSGENLKAYNEATQQLLAHRSATDEASLALEHYSAILQDTYVAEMQTTKGAMENSTAFADVSTVLSGYTEKLQGMSNGLANGSTSFKDTKNSLVDLQSQLEMATGDSLPGLKEAFDKALRAGNSKQLTKAIDELMEKLKQAKIPAKDLEKILTKLGQGKTVDKIKKGYKDLGKATDDLKKKQEAVNRAVQQFNPKHTLSGIEALTKGAAGLSSLAMAAQSVRSIFEAWNNDDLSWGEKLTTTLISLGMVIPMVKNGFGSLISVGTGLVGLMSTQLLAASSAYVAANYEEVKSMTAKQLTQKLLVTEDQAAVLIAQAKTLALKENIAAMTAEQLAAKTGMTIEQAAIVIKAMSAGKTKEEALAEAGLTATKGKGLLAGLANIGIKITEAIARKANKAATDSETKSLWAETAAKIASQAAAWPMLVVTLLLVAAIGLLVAIIWGVVAAFQAFAANSPEGQLKAAEETAAELSAALDVAKQKAEDLKNAFNSYDEVVNKLAECEKGTREWTEALQNVNAQVLDLMKQYPELSTMVNEAGESAISYGDSGEMVIADWAREKLIGAANENVQVAQAASIEGNQNVRQKKINILEEEKKDAETAVSGNTYVKEAYLKASKQYGDALTEDQFRETLVSHLSANNLSWSSDVIDSWVEKAGTLIEVTDTLTAAIEENSRMTDAENRVIAASALSNNTTIQNSDLSEDILNTSGHLYKQLNDEAMQKLKDDGWGKEGIAQIDGANEEAKKIFAEYAEAAGLKNYKLTDTTGNDDNRKFVYEDENGEEKTISLDAMMQTKAAFDAMADLGFEAENLALKFETLAEDTKLSSHALQNFLANQNFFQATGSEVQDIQNVTSKEGVEVYLDRMVGDNSGELTDATAQKYGFESADAMVESFNKQIEEVNKQWDKIEQEVPEGLSNIRDMSLESAQALMKDYEVLRSGPGGDEAVDALTEKINHLKGLMSDPEDVNAFMEQIGNIDWSDWNAIEDLEQMMTDLGYSIDFSSREWVDFTNQMRTAAGASPAEEFNKIKDNLSGLGSAIKGINPSDVIDEKQYESLISLNEDLKDSFIQTADGFKYIGTEGLSVDDLKIKDDLEAMQEASSTYKNAEKAYKDSNINTMAQSSFYDLDKYDKQIEEKKAARDAKEKHFQKGFDTTKEEQKVLDGMDEDIKQVEAQRAKAKAENDKLKNNLKASAENIKNDKNLMEVAKAMGYSEEKIQELIKNEDYTGLQTLAKNVDKYMKEGLDGAYDSTELQEKMAATAKNVNELNQMMFDGLITDTEVYGKQLTALTMDAITNASTLEELNNAIAIGGDYSYDMVADALLRIGEQYENCSQEMAQFEQALLSGNQEVINSAQENLEVSIMLGEAAEKYGSSAEEMEIQASQLAKQYGISEKAAAKLAIQNQRMNTGVASLSENWQDWKKELKKSDKTTTDYAKATAETTKAIADLVGASEDLELPPEFLESDENLALIEKAAKGDTKAIQELGMAVAKSQIDLMKLDADITQTLNDGTKKTITTEAFDAAKAKVLQGIDDLKAKVTEGSMAVGAEVSSMGSDWVNSLNEMAMATNMSVDDMNALLSELGVQTEVKTEEVTMPRKVPKYKTKTTITARDKDSGMPTEYTTSTAQDGYDTMNETFEVAQIGTEGSTETPKITYAGRGSVSSSSTSSGSGGGSNNSSKKSDVVKRYKEVDDKLDQNTKKREKLEAMTDTLTGQARLDNIKAIIEKRKEENKLLEEKYQWAKKYAEEDKKDLDKAAAEANVKFEYNEDGTIKNYTEVMTSLYDKYNADGNIDEDEQEKLDNITSAMDAYEESLQTQDELEQQHLDNQLANQQEYLDGINTFYDEKQSLLDSDNEFLEYYLTKYEKNFSKHIDSISDYYKQQGTNIGTSLENLKEKQDKLRTAYENGEINLVQFREASQQSQSDIIAQLQAYDDLTETMNNLYGSAMEDAREEIDLYTSQQEHLNSVLEHYSSVLDLVGKEQDYAAKRNILTSKANNINNELKTQTELYEQYSANAIYWEEEMNKAKQEGRELDYERYKTYWQNAQESANEAQENMLSKTEEWAEAMRAVVENELADLGKTLEKSMTGEFGNFDNLNTAMERASSLQEEYLTTTNKIYETNKLMRQTQQEIDKTTNTVAKNRMKQFINETQQLQNQNKLSQYELDIQQAKYDLLLAEIALEEAQNAKSTVRLQRDAEGNFGYVYTADSSKIADAEQKLADAQNSLYNKGLEGANDYNQKYAEIMSEMYDTLTELQTQYLDGAFATEEDYQNAMTAAKEYYYQKLEDYSSLHAVALSTDSRIIADAWSTDFNSMVYKTEDWKKEVEKYSNGVAIHLETWSGTVKTTLEKTGLTDTKEAVKGINTESENLAKTLLGEGEGDKGLVGALEKTSEQVQNQQTEFENLATDIEAATKEYEEYLKLVRQDINANKDHTKIDGIDQGSDNDNTNNNSSDNNSNKTTQPSLTIGSSIQVKPGTKWYGNSYGGGSYGTARDGVIKYISTNGTHQYNIGGAGWIRKEDIVGYDTGGYTGDWGGSYGKLAMLHKKELVLEPGDTQNFLMSMEILDRIVSAIDLYSMNAQLGGLLNSPTYSGSNSPETLEQNVHIEASFPGITEHNELEIALTDLINQASQYANRK